jgi:hypothetical protein
MLCSSRAKTKRFGTLVKKSTPAYQYILSAIADLTYRVAKCSCAVLISSCMTVYPPLYTPDQNARFYNYIIDPVHVYAPRLPPHWQHII